MADAPEENRVPADLAAVNLQESWEITYWCTHFRCTEAQLRAAMKECGSIITDDIAAVLRRDARAPGGR